MGRATRHVLVRQFEDELAVFGRTQAYIRLGESRLQKLPHSEPRSAMGRRETGEYRISLECALFNQA